MRRTWVIQGLYGYWNVNEMHPDDGTGGVYDVIGPFPTKKLAVKVAHALNQAYSLGASDPQPVQTN